MAPPNDLFAVPLPAGATLPNCNRQPMPNGTALVLPDVPQCGNVANAWLQHSCNAFGQNCRQMPITPEVKTARLSGFVSIEYALNPEGRPLRVHLRRGVGLGLDAEAVECVATGRYQPILKDTKQVSVTFNVGVDSDSDWPLKRVSFAPPDDASRPIFVKTKYPSKSPDVRVCGFVRFRLQLIVGSDGVPRNIRVIPPVNRALDKSDSNRRRLALSAGRIVRAAGGRAGAIRSRFRSANPDRAVALPPIPTASYVARMRVIGEFRRA